MPALRLRGVGERPRRPLDSAQERGCSRWGSERPALTCRAGPVSGLRSRGEDRRECYCCGPRLAAPPFTLAAADFFTFRSFTLLPDVEAFF